MNLSYLSVVLLRPTVAMNHFSIFDVSEFVTVLGQHGPSRSQGLSGGPALGLVTD